MREADARAVTAVATAAAIGLVILLSVGVGPSSAAIDSDTTRLSGTVTDEDGETIFTANVTVNGSSEAARTNADGFSSLELEEREDGETASEASPDARDDDPAPATNREQVLTLLFFVGTFLAAMITAAAVGLYRNRFR